MDNDIIGSSSSLSSSHHPTLLSRSFQLIPIAGYEGDVFVSIPALTNWDTGSCHMDNDIIGLLVSNLI